MKKPTTFASSFSSPLSSLGATSLALVLSALLFFPVAARADGLILRGGFNLSDAKTAPSIDADNQEARPGVNLALLAEAGAGPLRLLTGVGYENRGLRVTSALADGEVRLDYVTVPVMLSLGSVAVAEGGWIPRVFVNAGVEPAFLVKSEGSLQTFNFDIEAERFDFGLRGEAGVEIPISPAAGLVLGAGYSRSLTDASKDEDYEWYNKSLHFFGGIKVGMF